MIQQNQFDLLVFRDMWVRNCHANITYLYINWLLCYRNNVHITITWRASNWYEKFFLSIDIHFSWSNIVFSTSFHFFLFFFWGVEILALGALCWKCPPELVIPSSDINNVQPGFRQIKTLIDQKSWWLNVSCSCIGSLEIQGFAVMQLFGY